VPELPDVTVYVERLLALAGGQVLERVRVSSPFVVRSFDPPVAAVEGRVLRDVQRLGKRIVIGLDEDLYVVLHLMIAGRLRWRPSGAVVPRGNGLAAFDFSSGTLLFTEASKQKRASLHVVRGATALREFDRGGIEPLTASAAEFREALLRENRTLKRALADPRLFSGIGNAYSDEILHAAGLSPVTLTRRLERAEITRLRNACRKVLAAWIEKLRRAAGSGFPEKVTAFHEDMAVHGRYRQPCRKCKTLVQRIRYAANEVNYCPRCQTGGKLLADRGLSRLLRQDWPRSIDDLEERLEASRSGAGS
jgi:formamidopyrimidine-DNA glycosylase